MSEWIAQKNAPDGPKVVYGDQQAASFAEAGKPQLGKFYELETSSPARELKKGQTLQHTHRTIHFQGDEKALDAIAKSTLGVSLSQIQSALK